ncbi:MAG: MoaF C-terminal domain-containing protein [Leucobacter sp.]
MIAPDFHPTAEDQGFVATEDWPDVTRMLDGFGEPSLGPSRALEGRSFSVELEGDRVIAYAFAEGRLTWEVTAGQGAGAAGAHRYRAVELRPGIFFIDFLAGEGAHQRNVSIVLDLGDGRVTLADSRFVDRKGSIRMETEILSGRLSGTGEIEPRPFSAELVGKRIFYRYSPTEQYEHIYLNRGTFVWHCVRGGEAGLADVDPIQVWAVADDLVLLHWSETVMPVESIVAIDLKLKRSIGRMFCWDGPTLAPVQIPFDSEFTVLSDTRYPRD